jgi:hypothetical protein
MCRKDFDRGLRNADVHGFRLLAGVCASISMLPGLHTYACCCRIGTSRHDCFGVWLPSTIEAC